MSNKVRVSVMSAVLVALASTHSAYAQEDETASDSDTVRGNLVSEIAVEAGVDVSAAVQEARENGESIPEAASAVSQAVHAILLEEGRGIPEHARLAVEAAQEARGQARETAIEARAVGLEASAQARAMAREASQEAGRETRDMAREQARGEVRANVGAEVAAQVRADVASEASAQVRADIANEASSAVRQDVRNSVRAAGLGRGN